MDSPVGNGLAHTVLDSILLYEVLLGAPADQCVGAEWPAGCDATPMEHIDRRGLLVRGGRMTAGLGIAAPMAWLGVGCGSSARSLASLRGAVAGRVVGRGDPGYSVARQPFNARFDNVAPLAIVYCQNPADVAATIRWSRSHDVAVVARNGGHSYGGYSTTTGVVADISRLDSLRVDAGAGTAEVGAGKLLIDLYAGLARHGRVVPAGTCPTVGITGLALGGGVGLSSRKLGLTCDKLLGLEMVTAGGEAVRCDARHHSDLLWASRGGGGGNFGIVTSLQLRTHPVDRVSTYQLQWPWSDAAAAIEAWQRLAPHAPDELTAVCKLVNIGPPGSRRAPIIESYGQYYGPRDELATLIEPLAATGRATSRQLATMPFLQAALNWALCQGATVAECRLPSQNPHGILHRTAFRNKSSYVNEPLDRRAIETALDWMERWPGSSDPIGGSLQLNADGGAVNRVPPAASAFVHRNDLFHAQFIGHWTPDDPPRVASSVQQWVRGFYAAMRPFTSSFAYQDYIDPELRDWRHAYYGTNYERLTQIKRRYDPDNVFHFAQSIGT
jgi:FAD/FMN-containing dehydrogenase